MLLAEVDLLDVPAFGEVPEMQPPAISAAEQHLGHQPVLESVRRAPFAGHERVVAEMPPAVIGKLLRAALDFPSAERLEAFVIHHENAPGRLAFTVAERGDVDPARAAMDGVRARIAGL